MPFETQVINGKTFIAPGSIARNSSDNYNHNRSPQVVYLEFDEGKFRYEFIPLNVELDVFDQKYILENQEKKLLEKPQTIETLEGIHDLNRGSIDVDDLIRDTGQRFSKEAVEEALIIKQRVSNEN
jgi:hypothetical protein